MKSSLFFLFFPFLVLSSAQASTKCTMIRCPNGEMKCCDKKGCGKCIRKKFNCKKFEGKKNKGKYYKTIKIDLNPESKCREYCEKDHRCLLYSVIRHHGYQKPSRRGTMTHPGGHYWKKSGDCMLKEHVEPRFLTKLYMKTFLCSYSNPETIWKAVTYRQNSKVPDNCKIIPCDDCSKKEACFKKCRKCTKKCPTKKEVQEKIRKCLGDCDANKNKRKNRELKRIEMKFEGCKHRCKRVRDVREQRGCNARCQRDKFQARKRSTRRHNGRRDISSCSSRCTVVKLFGGNCKTSCEKTKKQCQQCNAHLCRKGGKQTCCRRLTRVTEMGRTVTKMATKCSPCVVKRACSAEKGFDHKGGDYQKIKGKKWTLKQCQKACIIDTRCKAFSWRSKGFKKGNCYLKNRVKRKKRKSSSYTGICQ